MTSLFIYLNENWPGEGVGLQCVLVNDKKAVRQRVVLNKASDLPQASVCELVIPAGLALLTSVEAPKSNLRRFIQALPNAVEDQVAVDSEELSVAAGPRTPDGTLPVVVTDKRWLLETLRELAEWGVKPTGIRVETLLAPLENESWTVVWKGSEGYARTGKLSGAALDGTGADEPPVALDSLVAEAKLKDEAPESISFYTGEGADIPDLDAWSDKLGVRVNRKGSINWDDGINKENLNTINLLQGELAPRYKIMDQVSRLWPTIILLCAVILIHVSTVVVEWAFLKLESNKLAADINQSFITAFPKAKAIVDAPLQMRRNLADMRWRTGEGDDSGMYPLLAEAAFAMPPGVSIARISYADGELELRLVSHDMEVIESMSGELSKRGLDVSAGDSVKNDSGYSSSLAIVRKTP